MAKKKDKKASKPKPKTKASVKKAPAKKKAAAKPVAKKQTATKKPTAKKTVKPVAKKKEPVKAKPAAKKPVTVKAAVKPVAKKETAIKPKPEKPVKQAFGKKDKHKANAKDARPVYTGPPVPRKPYIPPVEKPKGTATQLSMALEEIKPSISFKPRVTRSRSGNLVYQLEYTIRSSPAILYEFLTTPSGLAQWFADKADIYDHKCIFEWEGIEETATIIDSIEDQYIRYKWEDSDEDEYFEFRISKNEITSDTILTITDFASERDMKDEKLLWDSQVKLLVQQVGG